MYRQDAKSLALFRAIHSKITAGEPVPYLRAARDWAARFSQERPEDVWLAEWVQRLRRAIVSTKDREELYALMLSPEQHAIDMRSSSPFPKVLTTKERTMVLRKLEKMWRDSTTLRGNPRRSGRGGMRWKIFSREFVLVFARSWARVMRRGFRKLQTLIS